MKNEFVPYKIALELKELGFDEPCIKYWNGIGEYFDQNADWFNWNQSENFISIPLYQQSFRWLYQKLDIEKGVMPLDTESQELLLKELIDKVSSKHLLV